MPDRTGIDAAIEQVVKTSGDPEALEESVRELAGLLGYELAAKQPDPAAMLVHAKFGGHYEQHGGRDEYVTPCGTVGAANLTSLWNFISCDGCVKALLDAGRGPDPNPQPVAAGFFERLHSTAAVEYETDATPQPADGERGTCAECGAPIEYFGCPDAPYWRHVAHPAYCHDAELGGPA